jgi:PAS domain S-box-containing protein/putative nucleotidyltransferase with HDIG domain
MNCRPNRERNMNEKIIDGTALNVLSLEDSVRDFEIIREQLIDAGYDLHISRVEREKDFECSIRGNQYDIILADFKLPGFDAFGALRLCNAICPDVPFICVSGSIGEETAIELIKLGAVDYVLKDRLARLPFAVKRALDEAKEIQTRRRAEEDLKKLYLHQQTLLAAIPDIIMEVDTNKIYTWANDSGLEFFGKDVVGKPADFYFLREQNTYNEVRPVFEGVDDVIYVESWQRRKDGQERLLAWWCRSLKDLNGNVIGALSSASDITDRKRNEEALKESEERFHLVQENSPDGFTIFRPVRDAPGRVVDFIWIYENATIAHLNGTEPKAVVGRRLLELFPGHRDTQFFRAYQQVAESGKNCIFEADFLREGSTKPIWFRIAVVPTGENIAILAQNITERKQAQDALRQNEEKYRLLADNVNDVIFVLDMNLHYTYISPSVKILRGYEPEELLHKSPAETVTPASMDLAMKALSEIMELEKSGRREDIPLSRTLQLEMVRKDKTTVWTEVKFSLIRDENRQPVGIMGVTRDITERKQAEEQLHQTLDRLRKAIDTTIQVLVSASEARDPYTAGHQLRVADLAGAIAAEMGLAQEKIEGIRMAGVIHDIGKISIPSEILTKPSKLTDLEFSLIKEHSRSGYEMLKDVESPWPLAQIAYQHHERMDGSGYPRNLKGDEILIEARIMAVADVVEAMASHRPYRPSLGIDIALAEIEKYKGTHYDNAVADACLRLFREKRYQFT